MSVVVHCVQYDNIISMIEKALSPADSAFSTSNFFIDTQFYSRHNSSMHK